jgi:predicted AlkP superfamily phosphohydrolase/phosphomutase
MEHRVPFWDLLGDAGVKCEVWRIPAAYPIQASEQLVLSDMGTPDLQGGIDGMYVYYTSDVPQSFDRIKGGRWEKVRVLKGKVETRLYGPPDEYLEPEKNERLPPLSKRKFTIYIDPDEPVVEIEVEDGGHCLLEEGQWSDWVECSFDIGTFLPGYSESMGGMVKFYLQQVRPELRLYCSPVNIDPRSPAMPISSPDDDAVTDLADAIGPFYTQGLAEETKALQEGAISDREFLSNCDDIHAERMRMLDYAIQRFDRGLLFFYFSTIDLRSHMMWRHTLVGHPARDEALAAEFSKSIEASYVTMDQALGQLRAKVGRDTELIVISDHGFSPVLRKVNLNDWLLDEGYLGLTAAARADPKKTSSLMVTDAPDGGRVSDGIDRATTRAYAMGFNGIYLNLAGREAEGIVPPGKRLELLEEIRTKLLALTDPATGKRVVKRVDLAEEAYHGSQVVNAPDLVIGYDRGYGASDTTALGQVQPKDDVIEDNKDKWSGNHLMAPEVVPGVFLSTRKLTGPTPDLCDVTATLLRFFDQPVPAEMQGTSLY